MNVRIKAAYARMRIYVITLLCGRHHILVIYIMHKNKKFYFIRKYFIVGYLTNL